jgi:L-rhamnose-H+ transport protein
VPPLFLGYFKELVQLPNGIATLVVWCVGVTVSLVGIVVTGAAGMSKERELSDEQKKAGVAEFNFTKGILVAIFSGVMSAGMAIGISIGGVGGETAGSESMKSLATNVIEPLTPKTWEGLPVLVVVLLGGFTVNFIWCLILNSKNRTGGDYIKAGVFTPTNLIFSALAGIVWYSQMVLLTMGNAKTGKYEFTGWTVFMSSQIVFSSIWGILLREWKGASQRTRTLLKTGLAILVVSMVIIGYGNWLKPKSKIPETTAKEPAVAFLVPSP